MEIFFSIVVTLGNEEKKQKLGGEDTVGIPLEYC